MLLSSSNYDAVASTYDFVNEVTTTKRQHYNTTHTTTPLVTIDNRYLYDHEGRKLKTWQQITNGTTATTKTLLSKIDYNEISQVLTKHLHSTDSTNFQQNVAYTYNERGWMLTSSAPLFAMQLYYNTGTNKAYNGNIMYQYWGTLGSLTTNYTYLYDRLNRLNSGASSDHFIERGIAYDMQGNITNLSRVWNNTLADSLLYSYTGNRLVNIIDKTTSATGLVAGTTNYTYDGNGNLLTNSNTVNIGQNKSYTYNLLDLPQTVTISGGTVTYTYDAGGNKLRKQSTTLGSTEYISGIQYNATITGLPDFIQTDEGRAVPSGTTAYKYYYYLGDNLGNTRITFDSSSGTATTLQKDDYLPFGMEINRSVASPKNEYLYNKKELQEELGQYDYGARFYDPGIARLIMIDPHSEKYFGISPYTYVGDNPITFIDPTGMDLIKIKVPDGNGGTKFAVVDKTIAKQAYEFAWKMYDQYGVVVTESYRTDEQQRDVPGSGGLKAQVGKSRHQQGFALDFGVKGAYYGDKDSQKSESLKEYKTEVGQYGESVSDFDWRYGLKDYPHFELDARDNGYKSFADAYETNKKYYKEKGGVDGLPIYDPNEETDVTLTYKVNGKDVTVHGTKLSDKEIQAIKDYAKTLPEKNKEDDKQ